MSGRYRHHSRERGHRGDPKHSQEHRRHSRSASPPPRRSRSRSRDHAGSSKAAGRVERSRSPRRRHEHARSRDKRISRSRSRSRDRERKRHKARRRSRSRSSSYDSDKRRRKKEKKEKKKQKQKTKAAISAAEWGKYGIISDMRDKDPEFRTWLVEEKLINPETSSDDQLKKLFKEFAEDYNTATLPHEKYYNMDAHERRMKLVRGGESNLLEGLDTYDPNADVAAHTKGLKRAPRENESFLSRDELEELRKVKLERDQIGKMKLLGMNIDSKTGVRMDTTYE